MSSFSATRPQAGLYAVYSAAILSLVAIVAGLQLMVPAEVVDYVSTGLALPAFRYGLLLSLIACGIALSGGQNPMALAGYLAILAATTWLGLHWAEPIVLSSQALTEIIVRYPVVAAAMSMSAGSALLLPSSVRRWLLPFLSAVCGLGLGLSVILESPFDYHANWFSWAGAASGLAIVLASIVLIDGVRRFCDGAWLIIAERILGSWLIAVSLMLTALSFLPQRPVEIPQMPPLSLDENNPS